MAVIKASLPLLVRTLIMIVSNEGEIPLPGRRSAVKFIAGGMALAAIGGLGYYASGWFRDPIAAAADAADPFKQKWDTADYDAFLAKLPADALWTLRVSLGLATVQDRMPPNVDCEAMRAEINKEVVWISSSLVSWPFKGNAVYYDGLARWVADEYDVHSALAAGASTFKVEQAILLQLFAGIWDRLTPEQRSEVLAKIDPDRTLIDPAGIALMSGTAAAMTLAGSALCFGFAFYTTMSTAIAAIGALLGVAVPWVAFTSASTLVAFLATNPFGWALLAVGVGASVLWLGGANEQKTAAFVCQINSLRVAAWKAAGRELP